MNESTLLGWCETSKLSYFVRFSVQKVKVSPCKTGLCLVNVSWIVKSSHGGGWRTGCVC